MNFIRREANNRIHRARLNTATPWPHASQCAEEIAVSSLLPLYIAVKASTSWAARRIYLSLHYIRVCLLYLSMIIVKLAFGEGTCRHGQAGGEYIPLTKAPIRLVAAAMLRYDDGRAAPRLSIFATTAIYHYRRLFSLTMPYSRALPGDSDIEPPAGARASLHLLATTYTLIADAALPMGVASRYLPRARAYARLYMAVSPR